MSKNLFSIFLKQISLLFLSIGFFVSSAEACTRVLFVGSDNVVITGRTMDWEEDMHSNLWVMPRGIKRNGEAGANSINWTSHFGSIIVSGYDAGTADGMNEKGLVANELYLVESDYGKPEADKPKLSISLWAQYVLDNFATVSEAVDSLGKNQFQILAPTLPNGAGAQLHLAISDSSGDSAIFEYIQGKLVIHHGKEFRVMTNSPSFDQQLALNAYWKAIGGLAFLPGTNRASDRFARAAFFVDSIPKIADAHFLSAVPDKIFANQAIASVTGIMRAVSVPLGISTPNQPNISSTLWRTIADQKNGVYFFDSATSPNTFWIKLADLDLKEGSPVKMLRVDGGATYSGNVSKLFKPAEPFKFLSAQ
jgi:penicillin V acylase-like amidase (Ntn superfamily)